MLVVVSYNLSSLPDLRQKQVYERRVSCLIFHAVNKPRFGSHASCSVLCLNRLLVLFGRGDWYFRYQLTLFIAICSTRCVFVPHLVLLGSPRKCLELVNSIPVISWVNRRDSTLQVRTEFDQFASECLI